MKYPAINSELFKLNRQRLIKELKPNSIAIFNSNDEVPRNGDAYYDFKQNSDIFHLSGIDQEETILVIYPDSPNPLFREMLFLKETNELIATWDGHKYTKKEAFETSGIQTVMWEKDFGSTIGAAINLADHIYLNLNENDRFNSPVPYRDLRFAHELKQRFPLHKYERLAPIMARLRSVKSDHEVALIKEAIRITDQAFRRVLNFVKPGVKEYEIEAELIHEILRERGSGFSFHPIVASGGSACVLHYIENNKECKDGDLLLLDFGVEYANYCSDMTRVFPVNGTFTQRQKDVYNAVLRVMRQATTMLVPGCQLMAYHEEVGKLMEEELIGLGLLNAEDVKNQNPAAPLYKKYFMHGTSHSLGLDVHDFAMRWEPMKAGMVFTCEPGIYIKEEGIGVRIENDILITEQGPINLMDGIPIEVSEVEDAMRGGAVAS